jgi:HD-GYP domain-containing protein (c-di-GMP phosphodiesterase class II)
MRGLPSRRRAWVARLLPVLAIAAAAGAVPGLLFVATAGGHVMIAPLFHVIAVGVAGVLAAVAAVLLSVIAARANDARVVVLGTAFSVMAILLVIHAVSTPGAWLGANGLMQLTAALNIPAGAVLLAASALPVLSRPRYARAMLGVQLWLLAALVTAGAFALVRAQDIAVIPQPGGPGARLLFVLGAVALGLLAWRAGRTYLLTRRGLDLAVTVGLVWLVAGQFGLLTYGMMDPGWWVAHLVEVVGIGLVGIPTALDLRYASASRPLVGDLRAAVLVADEEAFLGGHVRALMLRLAAKDPSTEDHTRRVATLAVQIGEQLGLAERRLRLLALGGLLHDMGKLAVPDHLLRKPGRLSDHEFEIIRLHPVWGRELLSELGGFPALVLRLVESHHERLDACGYPHRPPPRELELEVRILAVADVYDALTHARVYRPAWPSAQALRLLTEAAGREFDGSCVLALRDVVLRSRFARGSLLTADTPFNAASLHAGHAAPRLTEQPE